MRKGLAFKAFIYVLCGSFLIMMNGFPKMAAEAKEKDLPVGVMDSKGVVKFEARDKVWKEVEPSHFPIFRDTKVKVEKGTAFVTLCNKTRIGVSANSLFSFDHADRFVLSQGSIAFRIPAELELNFKAGNLSIQKSKTLQAAAGSPVPSKKDEAAIGSISIHSNGSVSIRSIQGKLSILNQDRVLLAALSSKEEVTIPSTGLKSAPKAMVAQVGEAKGGDPSNPGDPSEEFLGLSTRTWAWIGAGAGIAAATGAGVGIYENNKGDDDHDFIPLCR